MTDRNSEGGRGASRREFVGRAAGGACLLAALPVHVLAAPPRAEEGDETSVQLGYRHDTKSVDKKKYPRHAATQECVNCAMWQGTPSDAWAGCAMFGRKQIAAKGWCQAWAPKPA